MGGGVKEKEPFLGLKNPTFSALIHSLSPKVRGVDDWNIFWRLSLMLCTSFRDKDQDSWYPGHSNPHYDCAEKKKGGGWFSSCGEVHLTGLLTSSSQRLPDDKQLHWHRGGTRGNTINSWKEAEMKLVEEPWDGTPGKERCRN